MNTTMNGIDRRGFLKLSGGAALIAGTGSLLSACSDTSLTSSTSSSSATLRWANAAAAHRPGQEALGQASKTKLGIGLDNVFFASETSFDTQVRTSLSTAQAFPLFDWHTGYQMGDVASKGLLLDVSDLWKQAVAKGMYSKEQEKLFQWKGVTYGLPKLVNYWGVLYNTKVFSRLGVEPPTTWDELLTLCATMKKGGVYPFGINVVDADWQGFIFFEEVLIRTDPELYNGVLSGEIPYDDPRVLSAVESWRELLAKEYITPGGFLTTANAEQQFAAGKFGMWLIGDWESSALEKVGMVSGTDYKFFVMPSIGHAPADGKIPIITEARPITLSAKSSQLDPGRKWAEWFLGVDAATIWADTMKINSPNLLYPESKRPALLKQISSDVAAGKYQILQRFYEGTPTPVVNAVDPLLAKFTLKPEDPKAAFAEIQSAAAQAWKQYKSTP